MVEIKARIRAARAYAGLSQHELAERLDVHPNTIIRYEDDRPENKPKAATVEKIARICNVPDWFFEADWRRPAPQSDLSDYPDPELATEVLRRGLERLGLEEGIDASETGQGGG